MHGHRQSGKSTVIYAVQRYLHTLTVDMAGSRLTTPDAYIISFNAGIDIDNGVDAFWMSICKKLRVLNPTLFTFDEQLCVTSHTFESFFLRQSSSRPMILFIDEASYLVGKDLEIINSLLDTLRLLKGDRNNRCLHAIALIGIETIKWLLQRPGSLSPFTAETVITPEQFNAEDIVNLLDQYSKQECVEFDSVAIAEDIFECTLSHKGLVGTCCRVLVKRDANLEEILAEGILIRNSMLPAEMDVKCAAPIYYTLQSNDHNLAPQHIFALQTTNSDGHLSEYAFQFEFAAIIKHLLSPTYADLLYHVLPELPPYGFELLVQGDEAKIDEHLKKSDYYCMLHKCCAVYMVNLTDNANANYYRSTTYKNVIPLHVIYDKGKGTTLIKYKDHQEQVSFCGSSWNIVFKQASVEID
ncbi:5482_t:CDS:2 [Paraglomus occultum]|uniref:5482_t:CDS:1 n=1 Tax=Paraglomus occultum TaxID=144539 RepID=A0A9N9CMB0_9GLOM|nr:5482_t:CDS:2 [Paraglomus occultum]